MNNEAPRNYKLSRLSNLIFDPKMYRTLVIINAVLVIATVFLIKGSLAFRIAFFALTHVLMISDMLYHTPRSLTVRGGCVEFDEFQRMRPSACKFVMTGTRYKWVKVSYSVSDVENVRFYQNFLEKRLNVGRVTFSGNAVFTTKREKDMERVKIKSTFTVYGVKDFYRFRSKFI